MEQSGFDAFYAQYPRKTGRQAALKAWGKLKPDVFLIKEIMDGLSVACEGWAGKEVEYIPHPATWLNGRRWEDQPSKPLSAVPEGRPNFFTGLPQFEPITEEERQKNLELLKDLREKLIARLDMRSRLRLNGRISAMHR